MRYSKRSWTQYLKVNKINDNINLKKSKYNIEYNITEIDTKNNNYILNKKKKREDYI